MTELITSSNDNNINDLNLISNKLKSIVIMNDETLHDEIFQKLIILFVLMSMMQLLTVLFFQL